MARKKSPVERFVLECGLRASRLVLRVIDRNGENDVALELSSWNPAKGDTLAIVVRVPPPTDLFQKLNLSFREMVWGDSFVSVSYDGNQLPAYPITKKNNVWRALAPTTPLDVSGPGTKLEKAAVDALRLSKSPVQHWSGPFTVPAPGDVTTGFGFQRYYNGVFAGNYYHQGIDYGADEGTPVKAPAAGRVVLVGKEADGFNLHGNCIGLDHGQGVTSIMMHLLSTHAAEGEMVKQGQVIGAVGESGLATGPHLHWGVHVNGKAVDPGQWLTKQWWH